MNDPQRSSEPLLADDDSVRLARAANLLTQPPDSDIVCEHRPSGFTLRVPAPGIRGRIRSLLLCGVAASALFGYLMYQDVIENSLGDLAIHSVFACLGAAVAVLAFLVARQQDTISVFTGQITFERWGLWRSLVYVCKPEDIASVDVGSKQRGKTTATVSWLEVHILCPNVLLHILVERSLDELHWVAALLRHSLEIETSDEGVSAAEKIAPAACGALYREQSHVGAVTVTLERTGDDLTLYAPARGIWRAAPWMFGLGVIWTASLAIVICGFTIEFVLNNQPRPEKFELLYGMQFGFIAIAAGMVLTAVNRGRRRAELFVENDRLRIVQSDLFGSQVRNWPADEIRAIDVGYMKQFQRSPIPALQIHPIRGKKFDMLPGRDPEELGWIAAVLRDALHLEA